MQPTFSCAAPNHLTFTSTASRYWITVFPLVARELRTWRRHAEAIPDPTLRDRALTTLSSKRGNPQGAAAFAVVAPLRHRPTVIRALVAFQTMYDYLDTLSEHPDAGTPANARQLHRALAAAVTIDAPRPIDYYCHHPSRDDGGYLTTLITACREACIALPRYTTVAPHLPALALHIAEYQALNSVPEHDAFAAWARGLSATSDRLQWWEAAAAAGSSLAIHALIASSARSTLCASQAEAIEHAYFPWIGALHTLLDSLIDQPEDVDAGHHSFVAHYGSPSAASRALALLAERSAHLIEVLPSGDQHALILAGMASYYLTAPEATLPHAEQSRQRVLRALGRRGRYTVMVFRIGRQVGWLRRTASNRRLTADEPSD